MQKIPDPAAQMIRTFEHSLDEETHKHRTLVKVRGLPRESSKVHSVHWSAIPDIITRLCRLRVRRTVGLSEATTTAFRSLFVSLCGARVSRTGDTIFWGVHTIAALNVYAPPGQHLDEDTNKQGTQRQHSKNQCRRLHWNDKRDKR